jgi:hypothetical protein
MPCFTDSCRAVTAVAAAVAASQKACCIAAPTMVALFVVVEATFTAAALSTAVLQHV